MPKNFKSVYIGNETFFLAGGFDQKTGKTSKRVFTFTKGRIQECIEMYKGRSYFPLVHDVNSQHIYAIGGYNIKEGGLDHVERYSLEKKEWE